MLLLAVPSSQLPQQHITALPVRFWLSSHPCIQAAPAPAFDCWVCLCVFFSIVLLAPHRPRPQLSQPDSMDRDVLSHCLQLSEVLLDFLSEQQQQQSGLPPRLAQLCVAEVQQEGMEGAGQQGSLRDALQVRGSVGFETGNACRPSMHRLVQPSHSKLLWGACMLP